VDTYVELSDEQIVTKCVSDSTFLRVLINRYETKLDTYIRRKSNATNEDRKDILQNVFIKVYKNINDFDLHLSFSSWIYRIAHNEMIDWYRREKKHPLLHFEDDETIINKIVSDVDVEQSSIDRETRAHLEKVLRTLSPEYQEVVELRFFEEKSYEEISDILRIPPGTVAIRINRVKKKLKELLHAYAHQ
jgi:RNA polymerase sigma-70 factor (ECF subfamily)